MACTLATVVHLSPIVHDAVIIGGGLIGLSVARALAARHLSVLVAERDQIGHEASGAAAGMLAPQLEAEQGDAIFDLGLHSRRLYDGWIEQIESSSGVRTGYHVDGALFVADDVGALDAHWHATEWQRQADLRVERLDAQQARTLVPGLAPTVVGALWFPDEGQVVPPLLTRAVALSARALGVRTQTGACVERIEARSGRVTGLVINGEHVACGQVVVAAGAWSGLLSGAQIPAAAVAPVRGQMLALDAGIPPCRPFLCTGHRYIVPRRTGEVVVGSTMEHVGYDRSVTAEGVSGLLNAATEVLPALAQAQLQSTWAGLRPGTQDGLPLLGRTDVEGLWLATGHHRNGVLLAPVTAEVMGQVVCAEAPSVDLTPFLVARLER